HRLSHGACRCRLGDAGPPAGLVLAGLFRQGTQRALGHWHRVLALCRCGVADLVLHLLHHPASRLAMAKTVMTGYGVEHPAPFTGMVPHWLLFGALLAAPASWFVQLCAGYGLTAQACFPRETLLPNGLAISHTVWPGSLALNLGAAAVAVISLLVSLRIWL